MNAGIILAIVLAKGGTVDQAAFIHQQVMAGTPTGVHPVENVRELDAAVEAGLAAWRVRGVNP